MAPNPFLGLIFHWIGGLAAASFYIPFRAVKRWSWETFWIVGGVFSWIIAPTVFALIFIPNAWSIIRSAPIDSLRWAFFFGILWGIGGLTFGLTVRYLGIALGVAVALGCCAAFGTLVPPLVDGTFGPLLHTKPGRTILAGVFVCLTGIAISGLAGRSKELELSDEEKKVTTREFNFEKGIVVAIFCGILSACMAYGLDAGKPIAAMAKASLLSHGRTDLWQNLPVLIVVLLGGFVTNFVWCMLLNVHNKSGREYWGVTSIPAEDNGASGGDSGNPAAVRRPPLLKNYLFSAVAGVTWYLQFFFYSMGQVKMGSYSYSSWTLHMASIIIFSTLWGIALHEWRGTSKRTHRLIALGLAVLILSTVVIGYGNYLKIAMTGS